MPQCVQGAGDQRHAEPGKGNHDEITFKGLICCSERVVSVRTIRSRPCCQPTPMKTAGSHEVKAPRADRKISGIPQLTQGRLGGGGRRHAGAAKNARPYADGGLNAIGCLGERLQGLRWREAPVVLPLAMIEPMAANRMA
jgi:hypothetical protein